MLKPEDVTIIIPHWGGNNESKFALEQCLISLYETVPDMKKIIAVNGGEYEKFSVNYRGINILNNVSVIDLSEQGQCKAVNAAVATVNTPWIFITNDDMIYAPGWWEKLTTFTNPVIQCISPQLVEPRKGAPTFIEYFCGGAGGDFDKEKWLKFAARNYEHVDIGRGFNMPLLIKKELWDLVGGYDINYDPWGSNSDSDLEYKIKLAGVQPYQNTNCIVYHFSQTSGTFDPKNGAYYQRNFQIFKDKWGFDRTDGGIWEANFKIPSVGEGRVFTPDWEGKYGR